MHRRILKGDDDDHRQEKVNCSWFVGIEKQAVLTEVIMSFGDPRMDKKRCLQVMKKLLYVLNQGQPFTKAEAATVLVAANKLFRFQDIHLRKLVYLIAKDLCPIVGEVDILETSFIENDLRLCTRDFRVRANAVRLLYRLSSIETGHYLGSAIMDENLEVSIAGLVCAQLLLKKDPGIGIEICEVVGKVAYGSYGLRKFHALCLLFKMQQIETLGVGELARPHIDKILSGLTYYDKKPFPLSTCLMLRYIITQINRGASDASGEPYPEYYKYIKTCTFNAIHWFFAYYKGDMMVAIEGLRAMKQLRNITFSEVETAKEAIRMRLSKYGDDVDWFGGFRAMHDQDEHEIQSYLEANDVARVVKSKTEALATDKLRRRN